MRCDINEPHDVRIIAGRRNDRTAVTVPDEDGRPVLHRKHPFNCRNVIVNGGQRVLGDRHVVTIFYENVVDRLPSRSGDKCTMHEDGRTHGGFLQTTE